MIKTLGRLKNFITYGRISFLLGILYLGVAALLLYQPPASHGSLCYLFIGFVFACGILEIIHAYLCDGSLCSRSWLIAGGMVDLTTASLMVATHSHGKESLSFLLYAWVMYRAFAGLGIAFDLRERGVQSWKWHLILPILALLLSFGIVFEPENRNIDFIGITAISFLVLGIYRISLAFILHKLPHLSGFQNQHSGN